MKIGLSRWKEFPGEQKRQPWRWGTTERGRRMGEICQEREASWGWILPGEAAASSRVGGVWMQAGDGQGRSRGTTSGAGLKSL